MAKQQLKDIGILVTMLITIASCFISVGYNYKTINDTSIKVQQLEQNKLDIELYNEKHANLKELFGSKEDQNLKDHREIKDDLKSIGTKVEDIQRKVDKLSKNKESVDVIPTALAKGI